VGAIFDGSGYGGDGTVWGGELLLGGLAGFERVGLLFPVRLPGGDAAVRQPWRMACAWLTAAFGDRPALPRGLRDRVRHTAWRQVAEVAETGLASPLTTSAGRLFDAVAALCGVRAEVNYEGQAAVELEAAADPAERHGYPLPVAGEALVLDARPTIRAIVRDLEHGTPVPVVSARFHNALARATAEACSAAAERARVATVVLSGGVFQNRTLLARTRAALEAGGLRVLVPELLPPNDGGISYGQLAVATARLEDERREARVRA
jgi:hydrogenase maturation protein HypF